MTSQTHTVTFTNRQTGHVEVSRYFKIDRPRTWQIRDQMPDGAWGPERTVTLDQYLAEIKAAKQRAEAIFRQVRA